MGHRPFGNFHLNRHVSAIKCDQCLLASVSQKLIIPHYLRERQSKVLFEGMAQ